MKKSPSENTSKPRKHKPRKAGAARKTSKPRKPRSPRVNPAPRRGKRKPGDEAAPGASYRLLRGVRVYPLTDTALRDAPVGEAVVCIVEGATERGLVLVRFDEGPNDFRVIADGLSEAKAVAVAHSSNDLLEAMNRPNPSKPRKRPRRLMRQERFPNPLEQLIGPIDLDQSWAPSWAGFTGAQQDGKRDELLAMTLRVMHERELVKPPESPFVYVPWLVRYLGLEADPRWGVWLLATLHNLGTIQLWVDDDRERVISASDRALLPVMSGRTIAWARYVPGEGMRKRWPAK